ncbi:MAG: flagellar biosynthetic protein FliO [Rhabdochlamydiaceae bacterium]|nr:flagellar biosynthetic protein FliO [Rhabdochlamydiaceae bacterium]
MTLFKFFLTLFSFGITYIPLCIQAETPPPVQEQTTPSQSATPAAPLPVSGTEPQSELDQPAISYESAFIKMLVTLGGLILLVFLTIWILRRLGQGRFRGIGSQRSIEILEKRPLSAKSMLYIVQIGNKQVLISESQFDVRHIATIDETPEEAH